jgi:predicted HicB family RNase H-like nuclease
MEIKLKKDYSEQIGNVRVDEDTYASLKEIADSNDVSIQALVRGILEEAIASGLVIKF